MTTTPETIDEYLATVSDDKRVALEKLRGIIRDAAPGAEECISYRLPAFRLNGMLVAFGATARHCAFYLMSDSMVEAHREDLAGYDTSKGTIRFLAERPLPAALVRKLVKARIAENERLRAAAARTRKASGRRAVSSDVGSGTDPAVDAFMETLEHPMKKEIEAIRRIILAADPGIGEGIKWNAPSFRTSEYFATFHLRAKQGVQVILHRGAKRREPAEIAIDDPASLLAWLSDDRASVTFRDMKQIEARGDAFAAVIRQWIAHV